MQGDHDDITSNVVYGLKGSEAGERKEIEVEKGETRGHEKRESRAEEKKEHEC